MNLWRKAAWRSRFPAPTTHCCQTSTWALPTMERQVKKMQHVFQFSRAWPRKKDWNLMKQFGLERLARLSPPACKPMVPCTEHCCVCDPRSLPS